MKTLYVFLTIGQKSMDDKIKMKPNLMWIEPTFSSIGSYLEVNNLLIMNLR